MGQSQNNSGATTLLVLFTIASPSLQGGDRFHPLAPGPIQSMTYAPIGDAKLKALVFRPSPLRPVDSWYQKYLGGLEQHLRADYRNRWEYQDSQVPYYATQYRNEHWHIGSTDRLGRGADESDYRLNYAVEVLKTEVRTIAATYAREHQGASQASGMARNVQWVQDLQHRQIEAPQEQIELRVGWDAMTDGSKLEWVAPRWEVGVYHPRLSKVLSPGGLAGTVAQWRRKPDPRNPYGVRTIVTYVYDSSTFDLTLERLLDTRLVARVSTTRSLAVPDAFQHYISLTIIFE
jgi:hypothetical protein